MSENGKSWETCSPAWLKRYGACGGVIRRKDGARTHEHLMSGGAPVLWLDAIEGQHARLNGETRDHG